MLILGTRFLLLSCLLQASYEDSYVFIFLVSFLSGWLLSLGGVLPSRQVVMYYERKIESPSAEQARVQANKQLFFVVPATAPT